MTTLCGFRKAFRKSLPGKLLANPLLRRSLLGTIIFLAVTSILALDFYWVRAELEIGMPSPATFRADRTVTYIDERKTEELRENAARLVEPVYDPDLEVNNEVMAELDQAFIAVRQICARTDLSEEEKREQLEQEFPYQVPETALGTLLNMDDEELEILENRAREILQDALQDGIREDQLAEEQLRLEEEIEGYSLPPGEKEVLVAIITQGIRPNLVYNEAETERRRHKARQNVEPVERTIVKGLTIVREGDTISREHLDQLQALGMLQTEKNCRVKVIGLAVLVLAMFGLGAGYLYLFNKKLWQDEVRLALLGLITVVNLLLAKLLTLIPNPLYGYLLPVAAGSMLVAILLDNHLAILFTIVMAIFVGIMAGGQLNFAMVALVGGVVGTYSVSRLNQRSDLTRAGLFIAGANLVIVVGIGLFTLSPWQEVSRWALLGIINGMLAAVLTIGLLPYLENSFNLTTAVKLLEISNPNHPLLKRLLLEAPGTYHHSILVGNLSEAAAEAVGADSLLVRAGAYYHDIGKLRRPYFFIENQVFKENPHDKVSPNLSALIITSHVKDGVELARQYQLPPVIQDIIAQHHGTCLVSYFYHRALEAGKEQKVEEGKFRYDGPKPQTREAAIVMLADSVEAAVRSLARPNPSRIEGTVYKLIKERLHDGQLDECDLTFRDLDAIAGAFTRVLGGIFHTRIEYPVKIQRPGKESKTVGILVQNLQEKVPCPQELVTLLERAVNEVLTREGISPETEVSIVLVDDEYIRRYNAQYRGIDLPTDVLSFHQLEPGEEFGSQEKEHLLGDIMVSLERANLQAQEYGHSLAREVVFLVVHGMYHLLGYDHDTEENRKLMREKEEAVLSSLGLERG